MAVKGYGSTTDASEAEEHLRLLLAALEKGAPDMCCGLIKRGGNVFVLVATQQGEWPSQEQVSNVRTVLRDRLPRDVRVEVSPCSMAEAHHPETALWRLRQLAVLFPSEVRQNPIMPLLALERACLIEDLLSIG